MRYSVAMTAEVEDTVLRQLERADGQEDVAIATYAFSTGAERTTAIVQKVILPDKGDRLVHGNASFTGGYVLRAASEARAHGHGIVLLHSHPRGEGWQKLSVIDHDTESDYERVARSVTSMPLIGMTLGVRDRAWSARLWLDRHGPTWAESVRSVSNKLRVTWNDEQRKPPTPTPSQRRTVSSWGEQTQASLTRLRVLVVGCGSVGLDVTQRLAATGISTIGVMDFDTVEEVNLDRMIGATRLDVRLRRTKVEVASRLMKSAATAASIQINKHDVGITDQDGLLAALDYDVIFSCVDSPWPRAVLNALAYADLIPVIDGGIALDAFETGKMRNGIWRSHTLVPGRPCMACLGQLVVGEIALDRDGLLDDPRYIAGTGRSMPSRQNVAALSASVSAALLAQFVSLVAHPGGRGTPVPLRYTLSTHSLEHSEAQPGPYCPYEQELGLGDRRTPVASDTNRSTATRKHDTLPTAGISLRALGLLEELLQRAISRL